MLSSAAQRPQGCNALPLLCFLGGSGRTTLRLGSGTSVEGPRARVVVRDRGCAGGLVFTVLVEVESLGGLAKVPVGSFKEADALGTSD